jgi:hypothetical protein
MSGAVEQRVQPADGVMTLKSNSTTAQQGRPHNQHTDWPDVSGVQCLNPPEVLYDQLLQVPVAAVGGQQGQQRLQPLGAGLSNANQDACRQRGRGRGRGEGGREGAGVVSRFRVMVQANVNQDACRRGGGWGGVVSGFRVVMQANVNQDVCSCPATSMVASRAEPLLAAWQLGLAQHTPLHCNPLNLTKGLPFLPILLHPPFPRQPCPPPPPTPHYSNPTHPRCRALAAAPPPQWWPAVRQGPCQGRRGGHPLVPPGRRRCLPTSGPGWLTPPST